eukprot:scaffold12538_cov78-Skeletonema_dohrnii-CCMP3373.AAC.1
MRRQQFSPVRPAQSMESIVLSPADYVTPPVGREASAASISAFRGSSLTYHRSRHHLLCAVVTPPPPPPPPPSSSGSGVAVINSSTVEPVTPVEAYGAGVNLVRRHTGTCRCSYSQWQLQNGGPMCCASFIGPHQGIMSHSQQCMFVMTIVIQCAVPDWPSSGHLRRCSMADIHKERH